jgi:hypothetical protein
VAGLGTPYTVLINIWNQHSVHGLCNTLCTVSSPAGRNGVSRQGEGGPRPWSGGGIFKSGKPQLRARGILNETGVRAGPGRRRGAWAPVVRAGAGRRAAGKRGTGAERPSRLDCC